MNATRRICLRADPRSADSAPKIDLVKRRNVMRIMARRVKASTVKPHSEGYDAMAWLDDWMRDNKDFTKWPQQLDMIFGKSQAVLSG